MKIKEFQSYVFSALMIVCMLFLIGVFIRGEFFTPTRQRQPQTRKIQNWQQLEFSGQGIGPANAPVQIVEFFDYSCPFCKFSEPALKAIRKKYPQKVAVIYADFPLVSIHPFAFEASLAAQCVYRQSPDKFMAFHDSLFANQKRLGSFTYIQLAAQIGVTDTTAFRRCLKTQKTAPVIKTNKALGDSLGIRGTPTFIINDTLVVGTLSEQQLTALVEEALAKVKE